MRNIKELYTYLTYLLVYFEHMPFYFKIIGCYVVSNKKVSPH